MPLPPRRYFLFVALFFTCINMRRTVANEYQFLSTMSAVFIEENFGDANKKAYMDIATFEEFWEWARGPFTEGLLPAERYDGSEITAAEQRVMYYNKVVGGLRLRQLRIRKGAGCVSDHENIKEKNTPTTGTTAGIERIRIYIDYCYAKFIVGDTDESGGTEDRAAYSVAAPNETLIEMGEQERWGGLDEDSELVGAFRWRDAKANRLEGTAQAGQFGTYDGSGFVLDVTNLTTSYIVESFEFLEENTWLDRQTRGIFMSVMLFNANFNTYAVLQFFLELSPAGVMVPKYNFQTVKMDMYYNTRDIPTMAFEGALYLYMFIYICVEFQEIRDIFKATGSIRGYFQDFWNVLDWALIMFTYLALALRFLFFMDENVRNFNPYTKEVVEVAQSARFYNMSFSLDSVASFIACLKLFKFFKLQRNLLILRQTISRALSDLGLFTVMMMIMILAFAIAGENIFGQEVEAFVSIDKAFVTLFLMLLGEFNFDDIQRVAPTMAFIYFYFYQIFLFLVMVNVFLAILNDAYIAVMEMHADDDLSGGEKLSIRQRIERTRAWLHQRDNERRMQVLRKETRAKEMAERRKERVKEKEREKTIQEMQMLSKVRTKIETGDLGDVEVEKKGILSRVKKGKKGKDRGASGTALMPIGDGAKNEYAQLSEGDEPKT